MAPKCVCLELGVGLGPTPSLKKRGREGGREKQLDVAEGERKKMPAFFACSFSPPPPPLLLGDGCLVACLVGSHSEKKKKDGGGREASSNSPFFCHKSALLSLSLSLFSQSEGSSSISLRWLLV